jgi:hypothetical protein
MKKISLAIMFALLTTAIFAQDEKTNASNDHINSIFGNGKKTTVGWFVGPSAGYTRFSESDVALAGIQGGVIINHNFTIGLTAFGVANSDYLTYKQIVDTAVVRLEGGYGGLLLEYTLFPKSIVHLSFPLIIGGGQMSYINKNETRNWDGEEWDCDNREIDKDAFFVVEPGVRAELNVFKFMRLGVGVSYRYVPDLELMNTSKSFINNLTAGASLKFGKF